MKERDKEQKVLYSLYLVRERKKLKEREKLRVYGRRKREIGR